MFIDQTLPAFSAEQVKSSCLAMLQVARSHGLHPAESSLISGFWQQAEPALGVFDANTTEAFAAGLFASAGHKQLVLDLCLACAFADGHYSAEEKVAIAAIAAQLGLPEAVVQERTAEVRVAFLSSLAHLPDAQSVAALAKGLE
ncbi:TerB family tellurite resistance protein [Chitinimonas viridis]|uniref:TerB family tellurite resistance protein n=1 Tax=Chitinimonas viridis TaxID=664880 RepID=A0ABT8B076_9NEIS|nr:TerB family tellurite resistance protein [Chitinimonas viridis]MDN3575648.1 TerB family tellurite resistance protein [Chitinimonas viridis]